MNRLTGTIVALALLVCVHPASAQDSEPADPLDTAMVRLGPLGINPSIVVQNVGRDNNVFNDAVNPKSDFTFTLSPKAEVLFRPRFVHLDYITQTDYVYYRTYTSERGTNESSSLRADFDLARVQPFVTVSGVNSRARFDQEIDARARHHQTSYGAGASFKFATRTSITVGARRSNLSFDPGASFRGTDLAASLDSRVQAIDVGMGLQLTPYTDATVNVTREEQRFTTAHDRDANLLRVMPTVSFSTLAVITGSAAVGYTQFTPLSSFVPGWAGLTSIVNLNTSVLNRYQLSGTLSRDVQYSYDLATPYYVTTGGTLTVTMLLVGPFDVRGTGTRQSMAYRTEQTAETAAGIAGTDTFTDYGGGVGYRIRDRLRLGINADWSQRVSQIAANREYSNRRIYASLTWGVQR